MIILSGSLLTGAPAIHALSPDHYASSSVLSEGKWARIKVSKTGMHLISDADIRKLGFSDPTKVRVYGRGGAQCSPGYTDATPDDLPLQPSVRTQKGLVFFAADHITWTPKATTNVYAHDIHAYSHDNYYFLSDREPSAASERTAVTTSGGGLETTDFIARLLHEEELEFGGESGRQIFGEDFRTKTSQSFEFRRVDAADNENMVNVRFGSKTSNGNAGLTIKVNGTALPASPSDNIPAVQTVDYYYTTTETGKQFECGDEKVNITIDYKQNGLLFFARLDYIELFYTRKLALRDGELHFYGTFTPEETITVSGCSSSTIIWDVTDAAAPAVVNYTLVGDKARFGVPAEGYREFVAFEPTQISTSAIADTQVANQDLHALPTPDMVIITMPEYRESAERLARLHEEADGFRVHILEPQKIYNEFSGGKPDFGAFRNILKMWHDRGADEDGHKLDYCLLIGRPFYDNKRVSAAGRALSYNPLPIYESYTGTWEHASYCTDDYIAMLDDVEDSAFQIEKAYLRVAVGRIPATTAGEALAYAEKVENYVKNPDFGSWRNKVMIIADDEDRNDHLNQAQRVYAFMRTEKSGRNHVFDRLYLDSYKRVMTGLGPTYPQATERMLRNYEDGVMFTNYIGHGSPVGWSHEHLWTWDQINAMSNRRLTFILSATCRFSPWDESAISGGEIVLMNPTAGAIGLISTTRTVYVTDNGRLNNCFSGELFKSDADGNPRRFGDIYRDGKNGDRYSNTLRFIFMGDPAIRIPGGSSSVVINTINNTDILASDTELPELTAMSSATVSGVISRPDGSVDTDFTGNLTLDLYDAERVITTYGQGSNGISISYNDHDKRLSSTTVKVREGVWEAVLRVPPEIQGNYTPAMISAYAWSDGGKEANGRTDRLYVYGFNSSPADDTEGPLIEDFYINSPNFVNGGVINSNSVLYARISDESGINISDSGIGHAMTLTVDDSQVITGLNTYYLPDAENPATGILTFPVNGLTPGRHTLTLTVWDNANNVSKASLDVNVGVSTDPVIYDITASMGDTYVDFNISTDRPNTRLTCELGIFDLNGRRLWSREESMLTGMESNFNTRWDLTDETGTRVPRGIYIYRVNVTTPEGTYSTKSKKIAISAPK